MTSFEALNEWQCRATLYRDEVGPRKLTGHELVHDVIDAVVLIEERHHATKH